MRGPASSQHGVLIHNTGQVILLEPRNYTIGRSRSCDIRLEGNGISRQHARLLVTARLLRLEDLGSKNGTRLNDEHLEKTAELKPGDRIKIGRFRLSAVEVTQPQGDHPSPMVSELPRYFDESTATAAKATILDLADVLAEDILKRPDNESTAQAIMSAIDDLLDNVGVRHPQLSADEVSRLTQLADLLSTHQDPGGSAWRQGLEHRLRTVVSSVMPPS